MLDQEDKTKAFKGDARLIVVLGMHRSGTSAVTRALQVLGVDLGASLLPALEGVNDRGFWEDVDLNALNIEILQAAHTDWHHLTALTQSDLDVLRDKGYYQKAGEFLRRKMGNAPLYGFKDPRVAQLLSFWKGVFDENNIDVSYVLQIRNPASVAASLLKRDQVALTKSYFIWLRHVLESLKGVIGKKCVLVDYDNLMRAPEHELQRIAEALDLKIDPIELRNYTNNFLDQGLRHSVYDPGALARDSACPALVHEVYTELLEVAAGRGNINDPAFIEKLPIWDAQFQQISDSRWMYLGSIAARLRKHKDSRFARLVKSLLPRKLRIWLQRQI